MAEREYTKAAPTSARRPRAAFRFNSRYTKNQKLFIAEGMFMQSANVITSGVFLTGLLMLMGANNMTVGLIASAGSWSMMLSLIASVIIERVRNRKVLLTWVALVFRLMTTLPVFLPILLGMGQASVIATGAMIVAGNAVFSLYNTGFTIFFMDSLPIEGRASYFYTRILFIRVAFTVLTLGAGFLLDFVMNKSYTGFIIVFSAALAVGIADIITLSMIKDEGAPQGEAAGTLPAWNFPEIIKGLFKPLANGKYLRYLLFNFMFFFFLALSSAFTGLYQLKYLHLDYWFIAVVTMMNYIVMITMTRIWGRVEARIGRSKMLVITAMLIAAEFIVYAFLTPGTLGLIVLSPLLAGLGNSGYWACTLPYRYDLMPKEGKMAYEGWFWFAFGAAGLLGALAGGSLQNVIPALEMPFMTFSVFQILYLFSGIAAIATALVFWSRARRDISAGEEREREGASNQ